MKDPGFQITSRGQRNDSGYDALGVAVASKAWADYKKLRDAGIIEGREVSEKFLTDWPCYKSGRPRRFCEEYTTVSHVKALLHWIYVEGMDEWLITIGSVLSYEQTIAIMEG